MTVEDDSASQSWFAARRGSGKPKRSADAVLQQRQGSPVVPPSSDMEEYYSRVYSQIKDHARIEAYRDGILKHQPLISGKVVLNIGCGTGILAIFCALAGATRVYAIDESTLAVRVGEVVKENNLSDRMTVLLGRVEDVRIDEKVDVIISDWMGDMLLHKSMLPSIIFARDKWLKPGGLIFPSHASLYMALFTDADGYRESIDFWHDVYGINMSAVLPLAKTSAFGDTRAETISKASVLTLPILLRCMGLHFGLMSPLVDLQLILPITIYNSRIQLTNKHKVLATVTGSRCLEKFCYPPHLEKLGLTGSRLCCTCTTQLS